MSLDKNKVNQRTRFRFDLLTLTATLVNESYFRTPRRMVIGDDDSFSFAELSVVENTCVCS